MRKTKSTKTLDFFNPRCTSDTKALHTSLNHIVKTIKKLNLNLNGLTVLTEAANGNWIYLPLIAGLANASNVFCFTKDTKFGNAKEIESNFESILTYLKLKNIKVLTKLNKSIIHKSDIVTNSGHLRPLDSKFLKSMKKTGVISLMWEPWEFRKSDLDLSFCWKHGISILGVNENNSVINAMAYAGNLIKKIFDLHNVNIKNKKIILIGENISSIYIYKKLISENSEVFCISKNLKNDFKKINADIIGSDLSEKNIEDYIKKSDLILIASMPIKKKIIGGKLGLNITKLKKLNSKIKIFVYHGNVDYIRLKQANIECFPKINPGLGHMGWTADILGPKVSIETLALGLKTGEILANLRKSGLTPRKAEIEALKTPFCLDFSSKIRKKYGYEIK